MRNRLARSLFVTLLAISASFAAAGAARADNLAQRCLAGSLPACDLLHLYHYVLPRIQQELSTLGAVSHVLVPIPLCNPQTCDPPPIDIDYLTDMASLFAQLGQANEDPNPQPNLRLSAVSITPVPLDLRLKGAMALRAGMAAALTRLDAQIKAMH
jgi:hypothetical protein